MAHGDQLNPGGGIVTTVKKSVTNDLDVRNRLAEAGVKLEDDTPGETEEQPEVKVGDKADSDKGEGKEPEEKPAETPGAAKKDDDDEGEVDVTKLPKNVQSLINRANKEQRIARRDADRLQNRLDQMAADIEAIKKAGGKPAVEAPTMPEEPQEPDPADFSTVEEYKVANKKFISDMVKYQLALSKTSEKAEAIDEELAKEDAVMIDAYKSKESEYKKANPDYETDMKSADVELSPIMFSMVIEEGPHLGHYFALNPEIADEIKAITDDPQARKSERAYRQAEQKAMRKIDRIIVKLNDEAEAKSKAAKASNGKPPEEKKPEPKKQPVPIARVEGRGGAPPKDPRKMTFKEKEEEARRKGEINY